MAQPAPRRTLARIARGQRTFYRVATFILVVAVLYFAQSILIPLALAVLVSFALSPLAEWLERRRLGRVPSAILATLLGAAVVGGISWLAAVQVQSLARDLPKYHDTVYHKLRPILAEVKVVDRSLARVTELGQEDEVPRPEDGGPTEVVIRPRGSLSWLESWLRPFAQMAATAVLVAVLTVFLLVQRDSVRDRLIGLAGRRRLTTTTRALEDAARRVSRYLLLQLGTNATMGVLVAAGLYLIGVPYAPLWGLLTAALRFLPYVGIWLSAVFPFALAVATFPGWGHALLVLAVYGGLDAVMTNAVEPLVFGHGTGVSSLALLVAAVFWAWLWGPVGLLLAIPLTVCVVVIGEHVPSLGFLRTLLGESPEVDPAARYFHRLLARDYDVATVLLEEQAKGKPLVQVYDEVILPALAQAKRERDRGELDGGEERGIYRATWDMLDGVLATYRAEAEAEAPMPGKPAVRVVGATTRGEADRLALRMLRDVLLPAGGEVDVVPAGRLVEEVRARRGKGEEVVACVAAVSSGGLARTAGLVKQVRARCPGVRVVVGRWGVTGDTAQDERFLKAAGADLVGWTFHQTLDALIPKAAPDPVPDGPSNSPAGPGKVTVPA